MFFIFYLPHIEYGLTSKFSAEVGMLDEEFAPMETALFRIFPGLGKRVSVTIL